MENDQVKRKRN